MMNLILAICMYPTLLLMYFIQKGEGKEKMRTLFGVSFSKEWLSDTEKEALEAEYSHSLRHQPDFGNLFSRLFQAVQIGSILRHNCHLRSLYTALLCLCSLHGQNESESNQQ